MQVETSPPPRMALVNQDPKEGIPQPEYPPKIHG